MSNNPFDSLNPDGICHLPDVKAGIHIPDLQDQGVSLYSQKIEDDLAKSQLARLQTQKERLAAQIQELQGKLRQVELDIEQLKKSHPELDGPPNVYEILRQRKREFPWEN